MKRKRYSLLLAVFGFLSAALPAFAHHSVTSEFNPKEEFVVKGVLTKLEWTNPHVYYSLEATDENGKTVTYTFESGPPSMLHRAGLRKEDVKIGDTVTITA